ncbi:MAG: LysM peptidoglycan-binding domain-containing protein, partial [Clostridiaceae bacterium]
EILCIPGGKAEEVSKIILPEIVKLGFTNRGVKARYDLFVLNKTRMSAILIECAFCDSEIDMRNYDSDKMAAAIFNGICKAFKINVEKVAYHVVKQGDNLWIISKLYNTTVDNLIDLNRISNPNIIYLEQKIRVR